MEERQGGNTVNDEMPQGEDRSSFKSTDDIRTRNNATRHHYRTLTDEEKQAIDDIKVAGQNLVDRIDDYHAEIVPYIEMMMRHLDQEDRDANIAVDRLFKGLDLEVTEDGNGVYVQGPSKQRVAVEESVMWAVKSITK